MQFHRPQRLLDPVQAGVSPEEAVADGSPYGVPMIS